MDPISDLLRGLRLTGGIFLDARFTAPWSVSSRIEPQDATDFIANADHVIGYHMVTEGHLLLQMPDGPPMTITAGEVVIFPHGDMHILASDIRLAPMAVRTGGLIQHLPDGGLARVDHGGGGRVTRLYCGFLGSEGPPNPLLAALPRVLKVDTKTLVQHDWIEASVRFATEGLARGQLPASEVVTRLSETLLIEALRQYLADHPDRATGWLAGARDPQIGRALALIHADIAVPHTIETLAAEAAMSRSAFVDRFRTLVGETPIRYHAQRRLDAARAKLAQTDDTISAIAWELGFGSEEAFSRAFRREYDLPPGRWRDTMRRQAVAAQ
jgi:AraC-like DNA-binding protein